MNSEGGYHIIIHVSMNSDDIGHVTSSYTTMTSAAKGSKLQHLYIYGTVPGLFTLCLGRYYISIVTLAISISPILTIHSIASYGICRGGAVGKLAFVNMLEQFLFP